MSRIARKIPGEAKLLYAVQQNNRLLSNPASDVHGLYEPIANEWLKQQAKNLQ